MLISEFCDNELSFAMRVKEISASHYLKTGR